MMTRLMGLFKMVDNRFLIYSLGIGSGSIGMKVYNDWYNNKIVDRYKVTLRNSAGIPVEHNISKNEFQGFLEYHMTNYKFDPGYFLIKQAIEHDYNNLGLFEPNQITEYFERIAIDQNIEALKYCQKSEDGKLRSYEYARKKYGDKVDGYVSSDDI